MRGAEGAAAKIIQLYRRRRVDEMSVEELRAALINVCRTREAENVFRRHEREIQSLFRQARERDALLASPWTETNEVPR